MYKTLSCFFIGLISRLRAVFSKPYAPPHSAIREALTGTVDGINCVTVHAFAHGSLLAFRSIYDCYAPAIYRVSSRYFQSGYLAERLVSEVFSALWFNRERFTEPKEVKLFLFINVRKVAVKYLED